MQQLFRFLMVNQYKKKYVSKTNDLLPLECHVSPSSDTSSPRTPFFDNSNQNGGVALLMACTLVINMTKSADH